MEDPKAPVESQRQTLPLLFQRMETAPEGPQLADAVENAIRYLTVVSARDKGPHGLLAQVARASPNKSREVAILRGQHERMALALGALVEAIEAKGHYAEPHHADAIRSLYAALKRHEREEASLIAKVWYDDLGIGG